MTTAMAREMTMTVMTSMKSKFPSRKRAIPSPSEAQWNEERASIDREILRTTIMSLKSQVSPGLSGFRYEHLQAILFSEHSKADREDNFKIKITVIG